MMRGNEKRLFSIIFFLLLDVSCRKHFQRRGMNHTTTEIRDGKDLLGQPVHFPVNAEKLLSTVRFFKDFVQSRPTLARKLQLKSVPGWL